MNPQLVHVFALIGLRALADYDLVEFRRSTDLSKRQLDEKIDSILTSLVRDSEESQLTELKGRLDELRTIEREAEGQTELTYLLKQLNSSCMQRAQQFALAYARSAGPRPREATFQTGTSISMAEGDIPSREDEFLRLGVMRLLRNLPEYTARFGYRVKDRQVDCLLEPIDPNKLSLPLIAIEAKVHLRSSDQAEYEMAHLRRLISNFGKHALAILLTTNVGHFHDSDTERGSMRRNFVLVFDSEKNEFVGEGLSAVTSTIYTSIARKR